MDFYIQLMKSLNLSEENKESNLNIDQLHSDNKFKLDHF